MFCLLLTSVLLRNVVFVPHGFSVMAELVTVRFWMVMSRVIGNSLRAAPAGSRRR